MALPTICKPRRGFTAPRRRIANIDSTETTRLSTPGSGQHWLEGPPIMLEPRPNSKHKSTTVLVFLNYYGTRNREDKDGRTVGRETGGRMPENVTHRASRAAPGPDDTR